MPPVGAFISNGEAVRMHLQMITPTDIDWDRDGDVDLIVGDEDGRVALVENDGGILTDCRSLKSPNIFSSRHRT